MLNVYLVSTNTSLPESNEKVNEVEKRTAQLASSSALALGYHLSIVARQGSVRLYLKPEAIIIEGRPNRVFTIRKLQIKEKLFYDICRD